MGQTKLKEIVYEKGIYWVRKLPNDAGYEIYKTGLVASTRYGVIGYPNARGLNRAIEIIDERIAREAGTA